MILEFFYYFYIFDLIHIFDVGKMNTNKTYLFKDNDNFAKRFVSILFIIILLLDYTNLYFFAIFFIYSN